MKTAHQLRLIFLDKFDRYAKKDGNTLLDCEPAMSCDTFVKIVVALLRQNKEQVRVTTIKEIYNKVMEV